MTKPRPLRDPVEMIVDKALMEAGYEFTIEGEPGHPDHRLDFDIPALGIAIECKFDHTPRVNEQLTRQRNIILIQGRGAALAFAQLLKGPRRCT